MIFLFLLKAVQLSTHITVSIRFAFSIRSWSEDKQIQLGDGRNYTTDGRGEEPVFDRLPFGPLQDPIRYKLSVIMIL